MSIGTDALAAADSANAPAAQIGMQAFDPGIDPLWSAALASIQAKSAAGFYGCVVELTDSDYLGDMMAWMGFNGLSVARYWKPAKIDDPSGAAPVSVEISWRSKGQFLPSNP